MTINLNNKTDEQDKINNVKELTEYILDKSDGLSDMTDEDKSKMDARIMAKLKAGKKLTDKELNYLRKTNPIMYAHAMRVQRVAEAVEERLEHAKSKEEANNIITSSVSGLSKNDPDKEYIMAAVNRISDEFHKSGAYSKLPDTNEEAKKSRNRYNGNVFSDADEQDDEMVDLNNWSPLNEMYDQMPTFSVNA